MNCTLCGSMIPDGQSVCPNCGAAVPMQPQQPVQPQQPMGGFQQPVQPQQPMGGFQQPIQPQQPMGGFQQPIQPQQPMGGYQQPMQPQQPMGGYQQPMQPQQPMGGYYQPRSNTMVGGGFGAYLQSLTSDPMNIFKVVGALLLFIAAAFLPWIKVAFWGSSESGSLWELGGFDIVVALLLIVISVVLILWDVADYVPVLGNLKAMISGIPFIELILLGVALVLVIIGTVYLGDVDGADLKELKDYGVEIKRTAGVFVAYIGVIAAAVPRVLKMVGNK